MDHRRLFQQTVQELSHKLEDTENLENAGLPGQEFMLFRTIERILDLDQITQLVAHRDHTKGTLNGKAPREVAKRIISTESNLQSQPSPRGDGLGGSLRVFAILIQSALVSALGEQIDFWIEQKDDHILYDKFLPIKEEEAKKKFGPTGGIAFNAAQHCFSVATLIRDKDNEFPLPRRLPFLGRRGDPIGKGNSGDVYAIKVARGCVIHGNNISFTDQTFAEKEFREAHVFYEEKGMLETLRKNHVPNAYVVLHEFSLACDARRSLFYPKAEQTLQQFLFETAASVNEPGVLPSDLSYLRNANNLLKGLHWIHNCNIYHMDIHPRNILIFADGNEVVWKIADFDRASAVDKEPSRSWREINAATTSSTDSGKAVIACGNLPGTYFPPEASKGTYTRQSDVWSMGCVILLVYTCMAGGLERVGGFFPKLYDWHDEQKTTMNLYYRNDDNISIPNPFIESWLKNLESEWERKRETGSVPFNFRRMTDYLWDNVFSRMDYKERCSAEALERHVREAVQALENSTAPQKAVSSQNSVATPLSEARQQALEISGGYSTTPRSEASQQAGSSQNSVVEQTNPRPPNRCTKICSALRDREAPKQSLRSYLENTTDPADNGINDACPVCHITPLHWVITKGSEIRGQRGLGKELLEILLSAEGLDTNLRNGSGKTPWQECYARERLEAAKLLYKSGAECVQDKQYKSSATQNFRRDWKKFLSTQP